MTTLGNYPIHWVIPKKIHSPPTEEISAVQGGESCINVLNLYRMSGEGRGGTVNFLSMGGGGSFLELPIFTYRFCRTWFTY